MLFSVIIPVRPNDPFLKKCLKAINDALPAGNEVIIVADGWEPDFEVISRDDVDYRMLSVAKKGPAYCRHVGVLESKNDWICFIDSDVLVHEDTFIKAISYLKASNDAGVVGSYDSNPDAPSTISRYRNLLHHYHHQINEGITGVFWGAMSMIKKSAYLEAGGFNPKFKYPSVEDIDLGYRLSKKGYRVTLRPEIQVKHLKKWSLIETIRTDAFLRAKPWTLLLYNYRFWNRGQLNITYTERISAVLTIINIFILGVSLLMPISIVLFIFTFIPYLALQRHFYLFMYGHFRLRHLPVVFIMHQIYYLCAWTGWLLGQRYILLKKGLFENTENVISMDSRQIEIPKEIQFFRKRV